MSFEKYLLRCLVATTNFPGDDGSVQEGLESCVEKNIKRAVQYKNLSLSKGELTEELQSWIKENYQKYKNCIASIMGKGTRKTEYMYYGMVFTILQSNGYFFMGKNGTPINITCCKYCQLFKLNRKTLNSEVYTYNFHNNKTEAPANTKWKTTYNIDKLASVFHDLETEFLNRE